MEKLAIHDCPILVVDDIEWNRVLIGGLLGGAGFRNVSFASDGVEALAHVATTPTDLMILDIMMPAMDGFEVCRRMRANPAHADIPILVQTALTGIDDRNRAFTAGTTDLVCKPLDRAELVARARIHLENRMMIRNLQQFRTRVEAELAVARSVFEHLMPSHAQLEAIQAACGLQIRSHMIQSSDLGGDIWGVQALGPDRTVVYLLDTAGCGVSAALNACRLHTLFNERLAEVDSPASFLMALNAVAYGLLDRGDHAKVALGVIDRRAGRFVYATAAAPQPILLQPGCPPQLLPSAGLPFGASADAGFEERHAPFGPGAELLLLSNAVFDAFSTAEDPGAAVIGVISRATADVGPANRMAAVESALAQVVGSPPLDDHTLIWITGLENGQTT